MGKTRQRAMPRAIMRRFCALVFLVLAGPAASASPCVALEPGWREDFASFLRLMDCAAAELAAAPDRAAIQRELSAALAGAVVRWDGTIRQVRGERLYLEESFVTVEPGTRAARVMYYAAADALAPWQGLARGDPVRYAGRIAGVKVDALAVPRPLPYVELRDVRRR